MKKSLKKGSGLDHKKSRQFRIRNVPITEIQQPGNELFKWLMSDTGLNPTQVEILQGLYPIFKKEVYQRREQISHISRFGMGFFVGIILVSLFFPTELDSTPIKLYGTLGIIFFAVLLVFQMREHRRRHIMAKHAVIEIEKALRLFEPGVFLSGKGLYPEEWSHYKGGAGEITIYSFLLGVVAILAVLSLWRL